MAAKDLKLSLDTKVAANSAVAKPTASVAAPNSAAGGGAWGSSKDILTAASTYQAPAGGGAKAPTPTPTPAQGNPIDTARQSQEAAAAAAAEARRKAAEGRYNAQVTIAQNAKDTAKGQYDWLIDTLGSNKKDLLDTVALNESQGLQNYDTQTSQTTQKYDDSRKEILSTYRDLNLQQEKILRGSGMQASSRSQEASLRLNSLMGKDLSGVSKNEADSLALIGNAVTQFKQSVLNTKNSIERETSSKLDKAALDFDSATKAIDANLQLSANEREDAYNAASAQLAADKANIETWAAGVQLQAAQTQATTKNSLDNFIVDMTDSSKLLNGDLTSKQAATNDLLKQAGFTPLNVNDSSVTTPQGQGQNKPTTKSQLDTLLASGQITQAQYQQQLASLTTAPGTLIAGAPAGGVQPGGTNVNQRVNQDPLLASIFA